MSDTTHRHATHRTWNGQAGANGSQAWRQGHEGQDGFAHRGGHGSQDRRFQGQGFQHGGFQHHGFDGMARVHYTPEQRKQVWAINMDYRHKETDLYKQDNLTLGAYKSQLVTLQKEKKAKLQALLTPQQQQQIAQFKSRAAENGQVMAAARLERMKIHLQLTDDQEAKIKSQDADFRSQLQRIRNNDDLLPDQKREQMMALFTKQKDALTAVLTPDQQAKLKAERGRGGRFGGGGFRQGGMRRTNGTGGPKNADGAATPAVPDAPAAPDVN